MVATDGETGRGQDKQKVHTSYVVYGKNVMSTEMLGVDVSNRSRNRCSISKGIRGQWSNDEGKQQMSAPPPLYTVPLTYSIYSGMWLIYSGM